jgi:hypothetical protein
MSQSFPSWANRDLESVIALLKDAEAELAVVTDDADLAKDLRAHANATRALITAAKVMLKHIRSRQEDLFDEQETKTETQDAAGLRPNGRDAAGDRRVRKYQAQEIVD